MGKSRRRNKIHSITNSIVCVLSLLIGFYKFRSAQQVPIIVF